MSNNKLNSWFSYAYELLKEELTISKREIVFDLFEQAEEFESFSYRKIRLLALLRSGFPSNNVLEYMYETVNLFPHKPTIYNSFFELGEPNLVKSIFLDVAPKVNCFYWSDLALNRIINIMKPSISTIVLNHGLYECSKCQKAIPKDSNYMLENIFSLLTDNDLKIFYDWFENHKHLKYSVVIDGANLGRFVYNSSNSISHQDIETVTQKLIENGENPCIVLNEIHKSRYEGDASRIIWSPKNMDDDIYWMALSLNRGCTFVSNDKCVNWERILRKAAIDVDTQKIYENFKNWVESCRRGIFMYDKRICIGSAKGYTKKYFDCHLPLKNSDQWLCWK